MRTLSILVLIFSLLSISQAVVDQNRGNTPIAGTDTGTGADTDQSPSKSSTGDKPLSSVIKVKTTVAGSTDGKGRVYNRGGSGDADDDPEQYDVRTSRTDSVSSTGSGDDIDAEIKRAQAGADGGDKVATLRGGTVDDPEADTEEEEEEDNDIREISQTGNKSTSGTGGGLGRQTDDNESGGSSADDDDSETGGASAYDSEEEEEDDDEEVEEEEEGYTPPSPTRQPSSPTTKTKPNSATYEDDTEEEEEEDDVDDDDTGAPTPTRQPSNTYGGYDDDEDDTDTTGYEDSDYVKRPTSTKSSKTDPYDDDSEAGTNATTKENEDDIKRPASTRRPTSNTYEDDDEEEDYPTATSRSKATYTEDDDDTGYSPKSTTKPKRTDADDEEDNAGTGSSSYEDDDEESTKKTTKPSSSSKYGNNDDAEDTEPSKTSSSKSNPTETKFKGKAPTENYKYIPGTCTIMIGQKVQRFFKQEKGYKNITLNVGGMAYLLKDSQKNTIIDNRDFIKIEKSENEDKASDCLFHKRALDHDMEIDTSPFLPHKISLAWATRFPRDFIIAYNDMKWDTGNMDLALGPDGGRSFTGEKHDDTSILDEKDEGLEPLIPSEGPWNCTKGMFMKDLVEANKTKKASFKWCDHLDLLHVPPMDCPCEVRFFKGYMIDKCPPCVKFRNTGDSNAYMDDLRAVNYKFISMGFETINSKVKDEDRWEYGVIGLEMHDDGETYINHKFTINASAEGADASPVMSSTTQTKSVANRKKEVETNQQGPSGTSSSIARPRAAFTHTRGRKTAKFPGNVQEQESSGHKPDDTNRKISVTTTINPHTANTSIVRASIDKSTSTESPFTKAKAFPAPAPAAQGQEARSYADSSTQSGFMYNPFYPAPTHHYSDSTMSALHHPEAGAIHLRGGGPSGEGTSTNTDTQQAGGTQFPDLYNEFYEDYGLAPPAPNADDHDEEQDEDGYFRSSFYYYDRP